jgi:hypothetical protein
MMRSKVIAGVASAVCLVFLALPLAAETTAELKLKACTFELVDGTKVEGQLAVQFDMDDHIIVYSPRLATVRSFLKRHVHALTVDGKREALNPKRELTDEDRKLIGQVDWPDAPPSEGLKPAYTTEKWAPPRRLLVWARPGKSGDYFVVGNWIENGRPRTEEFTESGTYEATHYKFSASLSPDTDLLFPVSATSYQVRGAAHWKGRPYVARHIAVENNALFQHNLGGGFGNLWVHDEASFNGGGGAAFRGVKHTFLRVGKVRPLGEPVDTAKLDGPTLGRKWFLRKDDPKASMEIIGTAVSGDETHSVRGRLILSEGSTILFGPRCVFNVGEEATLELHSSSVFMMNGNCTYRPDISAHGPILVGTPARPIEHDVIIGLGFKDREDALKNKYHGNDPKHSMIVKRLHVHSADPRRARLVLQYHGRLGDGEHAVPEKKKDPEKHALYHKLPRTVSVVFREPVELNGIVFNDFRKGGIVLANAEDRKKWKNVFYGERNAGTPDELFSH